MADGRHLDESQARAIEEELFATRRQQSSRHMPVALPRQNFWESVGQLLADIAPTYFVAISALVASFFGAQAYTKVKNK